MVRLAADANVLRAAVLGGRGARLVLQHPKIREVLSAEATLAEVQEYALNPSPEETPVHRLRPTRCCQLASHNRPPRNLRQQYL